MAKKIKAEDPLAGASVGEPTAPSGFYVARIRNTRVVLKHGQHVPLRKVPRGSYVLVKE